VRATAEVACGHLSQTEERPGPLRTAGPLVTRRTLPVPRDYYAAAPSRGGNVLPSFSSAPPTALGRRPYASASSAARGRFRSAGPRIAHGLEAQRRAARYCIPPQRTSAAAPGRPDSPRGDSAVLLRLQHEHLPIGGGRLATRGKRNSEIRSDVRADVRGAAALQSAQRECGGPGGEMHPARRKQEPADSAPAPLGVLRPRGLRAIVCPGDVVGGSREGSFGGACCAALVGHRSWAWPADGAHDSCVLDRAAAG